ncbi:MAG: glutamate---cysteine ligase / carboxylate-amine ligase, partial [Solirubrobacteraceae bacterium]|nr:glutamate---cysteine ligase / carboxylate-amine ligase [Solirubrobacteraceae bacterium]
MRASPRAPRPDASAAGTLPPSEPLANVSRTTLPSDPLMRANFTGPSCTVGVEEELMIVDAKTSDLVNAIELLLEDTGASNAERLDGDIKPELMESVLEIATKPCKTMSEAEEQLRALRREVRDASAHRGLTIGSAGTHPFAMWEDQRIVARPRYRDLISALRFVARQELIFGMHVHIGMDDADKAIHVANGMRVHVPVLLALSANSPFWRGDQTGLQSTRTPIFRQFPRVGMPPAYRDWEDWESQVEFMVSSGVMEDYTYLWYDVRPHPNFGTIEIRCCDSQTRVEHTVALAALIQAMVKELCEHYDEGTALSDYPWQMLDENKWLAARHGLDAEIVDLPTNERVTTKALTRRLLARLEAHAQDLGSADALHGIRDLLERGNGASRQIV